jgi:hypothetical protein
MEDQVSAHPSSGASLGFLASREPHDLDGLPITSAGRFWPCGPRGMLGQQDARHVLSRFCVADDERDPRSRHSPRLTYLACTVSYSREPAYLFDQDRFVHPVAPSP